MVWRVMVGVMVVMCHLLTRLPSLTSGEGRETATGSGCRVARRGVAVRSAIRNAIAAGPRVSLGERFAVSRRQHDRMVDVRSARDRRRPRLADGVRQLGHLHPEYVPDPGLPLVALRSLPEAAATPA